MTPDPEYAQLLDDAKILAEFMGTQYWSRLKAIYGRWIERKRERALEQSPTLEEFQFVRGQVVAGRELLNLPEQIVEMAREQLRGHSSR